MPARASYDEGAARNSWLTGTAAWIFVNISQYILGIKPSPDGLIVEPCLPQELAEYTVTRCYQGAVYHVHVVNTGHYSLRVDGVQVDGRIVPIQEGKQEYRVTVTV